MRHITLINMGNGQALTIAAAEDGTYVFGGLSPGPYTIEIAAGFLTYPVHRVEANLRVGLVLTNSSITGVDFGLFPCCDMPAFAGNVTIGGMPVGRDIEVHALIDGNDCGVTNTLRPPGGGWNYWVTVVPDEFLPGCGAPGRIVRFEVQGRLANETAEWLVPTTPDRNQQLNLTVGDVPAATATPTAAPPVTPAKPGIAPPDTGSAGLR
jgi:hypothetical protein